MSTINISGIQISYIEKGFGDTLILLHGNPGSGKVWRKVIPNLSANYRVIAHDRQGFGHSDDSEDGSILCGEFPDRHRMKDTKTPADGPLRECDICKEVLSRDSRL